MTVVPVCQGSVGYICFPRVIINSASFHSQTIPGVGNILSGNSTIDVNNGK